MRPVSVFANGSDCEIEQLEADLHGRWRQATRTVMARLSGRPRSGRPRLGGRRLARRIAALLARPGTRTLPRTWRYLGRPQISMRTLYRRVRLVAIWRRPKLLRADLLECRLGIADY